MLSADKDDERNKEEKRGEGEWVDKEEPIIRTRNLFFCMFLSSFFKSNIIQILSLKQLIQ